MKGSIPLRCNIPFWLSNDTILFTEFWTNKKPALVEELVSYCYSPADRIIK